MLFDRKIYVTVGLIMTLIVLGCSDQSESKASAEKKGATGAESMEAKTSAGHGSESAGGATIKGTVMETFNSGGYTYLKLDTAEGETWAATSKASVSKGDSVELLPGPVMKDFHSKSLDRTFAEIVFSGGLKGGGGAAAAGGQQMAGMTNPHGSSAAKEENGPSFGDALQSEGMGSMTSSPMVGGDGAESGGSQKAVTSAQDVAVEKSTAENGYTIEQIYSKTGELDGQKVQVRGKVVKVSPNIMGKTWIHLQDGTGDAMKNTHDLVFTSQAMPEMGAVVSLEGVLAEDKDFGAGYRYDAIVEKAEIVE